jgi:hypothetical protein
MSAGRVTERTFYAALIEAIEQAGGSGAQEVSFNSVPDVVFGFHDQRWLLSVKIGSDARTLKEGFLQYLRHKDESGIPLGMLLLLPTTIREVEPTGEAIRAAVAQTPVTCVLDADVIKEEITGRPFPAVIEYIGQHVIPRLKRREVTPYPLRLVITLLQQQVQEMMGTVKLGEDALLKIITNRDLLMDLGHLKPAQLQDVGEFLASYIVMSQILFLRLFYSVQPEVIGGDLRPINHHRLRRAFNRILEINYRPIYSVDVLDAISDKFLEDVFDLIWGLEIERSRYELPGRIFHELMPGSIRKMLAAFYTRPLAADMLAQLCIELNGETVLDPACGSGTILAAAYRRKRALYDYQYRSGSPHKRFCEEEIFGSDIMPFAVHLASANLAAMDVSATLSRTQVIQGDSLKLTRGKVYQAGLNQLELFPPPRLARDVTGDAYEVTLPYVDAILMNPPYTKVERGIAKLVEMSRFEARVGREVGLWGHFIALADELVDEERGIFGGVIPINLLRGRESAKVRELLFHEWTPLYILKPTRNYGFSEWSEYRDILFIARKKPPTPDHRVRFALVKRDLTLLDDETVAYITMSVKRNDHFRAEYLDIDSFPLSEVEQRFDNMMWFCAGVNLDSRAILVNFVERFSVSLQPFPKAYFREGYRPVPKGVSKFLFLTRHLNEARVEEAFLRFESDRFRRISAETLLGTPFGFERDDLKPTLRTGVGLTTMDVTGKWDYITRRPHTELERLHMATGFKPPTTFNPAKFWANVQRELAAVETRLVMTRRINPYSPSVHLPAFFSAEPLAPSNQMNVVQEADPLRAKALCVLLNSALFLACFFLLKEESTGRYVDIRFYDLDQMRLYPPDTLVPALAAVFDAHGQVVFPALSHQLDAQFESRYDEFRKGEKEQQLSLFKVMEQPVQPAPERLAFDMAVCAALNVPVTEDELRQVYTVIVQEMIITRSLARD